VRTEIVILKSKIFFFTVPKNLEVKTGAGA